MKENEKGENFGTREREAKYLLDIGEETGMKETCWNI
jgi:hypothetical protein